MANHYKAFICYARSDERWAKWLHRSLERYRVPARLKQHLADGQPPPRLLHPIFRDRDELASASDLTASIRTALDNSHALIVICSPAAAQSKWVNEEIRYFKTTDRSTQIFCLLVAGRPEQDQADCAFPPALLQTDSGELLHDPLAADVTDEGDSKHDAMLKIAAGLLGVGIDDLKQRDAHRQLRIRGAVSAGSFAVAVITIGFAIVAQFAREEADVRRAQAEGLINFMIGDLHANLVPLARLDLLDSIGAEAMEYFTLLGNRGTEQEVFARAIVYRQLGEVLVLRGHLTKAQQLFEDSRTIAKGLFTAAPNNNDYLFALSQAEFYIGDTALRQSQLDKAEESFTRYMDYSQRLLLTEPENPDFQLELSYAFSNLGTMAIESGDLEQALAHFQESLDLSLKLAAAQPGASQFRLDLGDAYSWVGQVQLALGHLEESVAAFTAAVDQLSELHASGDNQSYLGHYGLNANNLGNVHLNLGDLETAEYFFEIAFKAFTELVDRDPDNAVWRGDLMVSLRHRAEVLFLSGRSAEARVLLTQAIDDLEATVFTHSEDPTVVVSLAHTERLLALLLREDSIEGALELIAQAQSRILEVIDRATVRNRMALNAGIVAETYGLILQVSGDEEAANAQWRRALELVQSQGQSGLNWLALERQLLAHLQEEEDSLRLAALLAEAGFDDPRFR